MTRWLALSVPKRPTPPASRWLRGGLPGLWLPGLAALFPAPTPFRLLLATRRRCPVWLYHLLIVLAYVVFALANLLWKEAVFRHSFRISAAAAVKYWASALVVWFQTNQSTLDVFVGLLDLSLYAFVVDVVIEMLEDKGVPVRSLLRHLYRHLFPRSQGGGRKLGPRTGRGAGESGKQHPQETETDQTGDASSAAKNLSEENDKPGDQS